MADDRAQEQELALVDAWVRGSAGAATQLTQRYYASIRRFFDLRAPAAADDLTQQTFLAVMEARGSFQGRSSFKTFLFGIAHKQLLRQLRPAQSGPRVQRYGTDSGPPTSLSMVAARQQEHQLLLMGLAQLGVEHQVIVELYYWKSIYAV